MTLDEAMMAIDGASTSCPAMRGEGDRVSVLIRRKDGNFDLVES